VEVDWLVVEDSGEVWLAHECYVISRDVVEACWCLTIALVLHEGCHDRRVDGDPLGYGQRTRTEGREKVFLRMLEFNGFGVAELRMMV
jgi:hypothetical protein